MFSLRIRLNVKVSTLSPRQILRQYSNENISQLSKSSPRKRSQVIDNSFLRDLKELSTTQDWRRAVYTLKEKNIDCSRASLQIFNDLLSQAFRHSDFELGWELLNKINASHFQPHCEAFQAYWFLCATNEKTFVENVEQMLEFIEKHDIIISKSVINALFQKVLYFGGSAATTHINNAGVCHQCKQKLPEMQQSLLEFNTLKKEFENVIVKPKIPSVELGIFRQMVNKKKTFDYIIDALNVSRIFPQSKGNIHRQGQILDRLVQQLRKDHKKVFVVGKKHVDYWPEQSINSIRKNATVYLSNQKIAVDDIFMMYAALISGSHAHFVTNDLLIEYAEMFDESARQRFRNWQKQHQHFVSYDHKNDTIEIQRPAKYVRSANKDIENGHWHIPFTERPLMNALRGLIPVPIEWACVKLNVNSQ